MTEGVVKVLFVVNSLIFGGAEKHVVTLLNHLDGRRFRCSLVYLKNETALLGQIDHDKLAGDALCVQVRSRFDVGALRRLASIVREIEPDVVVATNTHSLVYSWLARRLARSRAALVEVFHSSEVHTLKGRLLMHFYRPIFAACDALVYVCRNQHAYWRAWGLRAREELVIHNGIDVAHFTAANDAAATAALRAQYGIGNGDFVVGLCGGLRPEKAHTDLLKAIALLRARALPVKALLIGDGILRGPIEREIAALGLQDDVLITGFTQDVRPLIACCNVMTLVSHTETFSLAALEAMSLAKPMIMSQVGGADEQVTPGTNGFLFPRGDIGALADAIEQTMVPARRQAMGAAARQTVLDNFTLPTMARSFEQLFAAQASMRPVHHGRP
ncbi:MAG: glycosyltransferase [Pseudomonadota bacterium]